MTPEGNNKNLSKIAVVTGLAVSALSSITQMNLLGSDNENFFIIPLGLLWIFGGLLGIIAGFRYRKTDFRFAMYVFIVGFVLIITGIIFPQLLAWRL